MAKPRKSRVPIAASRTAVERMLHIHQAVQAGRYPNAASLARELEVSERSLLRDIDFLRDRLNLPIAYDSAKWGYYYTEEVAAFPTINISEGELFALLVAEKALQQYRGTSFEKPLMSAVRKLADSMPETISIGLDQFDQSISFRTSAEVILPLEIFDTISKATRARDQLELTYRKPGAAAAESRVVDPYHLANINGEWFLFAYCHLRNDIRTFVPTRIQEARATGKRFIKPKRFSVESCLKNSFGVLSGSGSYLVSIHFSESVADYIREKVWHPTQKLTEQSDGSVQLDLTLSGLREVLKWILSWGPDAKVLHPPELVEAVRQAAQQMVRQYGEGA